MRSSSTSSRGRAAERRSWSVASCSSPPATDGTPPTRHCSAAAHESRTFRRRSLRRRLAARRCTTSCGCTRSRAAPTTMPGSRSTTLLTFLRGNDMGGGAARHVDHRPARSLRSRQTDRLRPRSPSLLSPAEDAALTSAEDADRGRGDRHRNRLDNARLDGWLNEVDRDNNDENVDLLDVFAVNGTPAMPILDFAAGHGTFAAGIIRQVDPQARIVVYRGLDTDGLGSEEDVACAMIRAAEDGAHVISLSLGIEAVDERHSPGPAGGSGPHPVARQPAGDRCLRRQQRQPRSRSIRLPWTGWSPSLPCRR